MANLGRKINNINSLSSFTAKVVYAASDRYGATQSNVTFTVGYEYTGPTFYKGLNRPPKLRILSVFQPLVGGNPNATNDTYVAFQIYDYTLNVFRGPWCKRKSANSSWTYVDYFVTTIDAFGRKYGNQYTGTGSSSTTFTAPSASFSTSASLYLGNLGANITTVAGHNPSIFTLAGNTNKTFHFHGFLTLAGYTGTWCFYSIAANGSGLGFNHLLDAAPYNTGTYPNVLPATSKLTSEWRHATFCSLDQIGYNPRIRINSTGLGPVKYYQGSDPGIAFPANAVFETEVWCTYDPGTPATFFITPLWAPGGTEAESALGVEETGAASYAPAGWYGTSAENSYAYWDGAGNWSGYATYGGGVTYNEYGITGPFAEPNEACQIGPGGRRGSVFAESFTGMGDKLYEDSTGSTPFNAVPGMWYYSMDNNFSFTVDPGNGIVDNIFYC